MDLNLIISFSIACFLVVYGGIQLTRLGDQFEENGISAGFVGTVLLALITSLPEFVATFSSIFRLDAPQLALGNIFGSNIFNLSILAFMDLFFIREVLYHKVDRFVTKSLAIGQMMTVLALTGIFLNTSGFIITLIVGGKSYLMVSIFTLAILIVYILAFKTCTELEEQESPEASENKAVEAPRSSTAILSIKFLLFAMVVVIAGTWLTETCDSISAATGLGKTFIGSILLAFATSLPEATVCITAMRLHNYTLVFGNILGSNIFNLFILTLADLGTTKTAILTIENIELNYITGFTFLLMSSIILLTLNYTGSRKIIKTISLCLIAIYLSAYYVMFQMNPV